MSTRKLRVWADVDLVPEARQLLAESQIDLEVRPEGSEDGIENADALMIGSKLAGNVALFARASEVQVLARTGIGYDKVDLAAATAAGVCAVNTPDAPTESTAEFTILLMLAVARRLQAGAVPLSSGQWKQGPPIIGFDLAGKTLGLVGCGRIGRRVAEIALALRMDVQAFDPPAPTMPPGVRRITTVGALLESSDVISLHVPLSPATRHLIGAAELAGCKSGAILINSARGALVHEAALLNALRNGRVAGAGLDVWALEPTDADNPLLGLPNVIATPHMAAATREGRWRSHLAAAGQVLKVLRDERPEFLLNPEVWSRRRGRKVC